MDQHNATPDTQERSSVGRRTVLKGAAWSVPAVAVVGATPAFADSNLPPAPVSLSSTNPDKNRSRTFTWRIKNNNTARSITKISVTTGWSGPTQVTAGANGDYTLTTTATGISTFNIAYTVGAASGSRTFTVTNLKNKSQTYSLSGDTYTGSV